MAKRGKIRDETKFRHEGDQIYVFKIHGHRFACFMDEHLVLITHGYPKQGDDRPPGEFERAQRIRHQYYEWKRNRWRISEPTRQTWPGSSMSRVLT